MSAPSSAFQSRAASDLASELASASISHLVHKITKQAKALLLGFVALGGDRELVRFFLVRDVRADC
eukprot:m.467860 g.467860  ORF g.467860 m.467860 type:complete len:66 (+) comp57066_c0_seq2:2808-3005(+)